MFFAEKGLRRGKEGKDAKKWSEIREQAGESTAGKRVGKSRKEGSEE